MDANDIKERLKQLTETIANADLDQRETFRLSQVPTESDPKGPGLTGDLAVRWENADKAIDAAEVEKDMLERKLNGLRADGEIVSKREDETGTPQERYNEVFKKFLRDGPSTLTSADREVLQRAQSVGTDSAGGYLVSTGFWDRLSEARKAFGSLESIANVIETEKGNTIEWPSLDDTANEGVLITENTAATEQDLVFDQRLIGGYMFSSRIIRLSLQWIQDSEMDAEGIVARKMGERLARVQNRLATVGTGSSQPTGIINGLTADVSAAAVTPTHDELLALVYELDSAYMTDRVRWSFNRNTARELRKVADGDGNKVWQPSLVAGQPGQLLGYEYTLNHNMPDPTSGNLPILFGDHFEAFVIRHVKDTTIQRLAERYAEFYQVGFIGHARMDSKQDNTSAIVSMDIA